MRLTLDVIGSAEQSFGPLKEHILSFRGLKIPAIENLGATHDFFDTIDFCDNDLIKLENFPLLKRISCLLVANNRIRKLDPDMFVNLPSLISLVLTNNKLSFMHDLVPLSQAKSIIRLSLVDNPVTNLSNYRYYLIYLLPTLRFLDFERVTSQERQKAQQFFKTVEGVAFLKEITLAIKKPKAVKEKSDSTTYSSTLKEDEQHPSSVKQTLSQHLLSNNETLALQEAIASATNLADVEAYEKCLSTGVITPSIRLSLNL
ncbi:uncharacterized protein LOC128884316 [Hylaeus volcanicus]|uniref:uncharacterized protein LOC128884316 n=1 Tax=Hylaeus volcanicus TaxID=313075 RepID=UPI0023B776F9|nr:uncharacterized protein LOC128884316 [Hylaeus volcanicus]